MLFERTQARVKHYARLFMQLGPVGVSHAAQDAWIQHRLRQLNTHVEREKDLHRELLAGLNHEINELVGRQIALRVASVEFRSYCERVDRERAERTRKA